MEDGTCHVHTALEQLTYAHDVCIMRVHRLFYNMLHICRGNSTVYCGISD